MSTPTSETVCMMCSREKIRKRCIACEKNPFSLAARGLSEHVLPDSRSRTFEELVEVVLGKLHRQGYCVIDKFHKEDRAFAILEEVKNIHGEGLMHNGQLTSSLASADIRGDLIAWVDGREKHAQNISFHMWRVDTLLRELNKRITYHTIEGRTQAMVACYPGGGKRYRKHVDNPQQDGRCITTLYYLNADYDRTKDGGVLRLYPHGGQEFIDIEPLLDRFLIFWSDRRNPHEVLPAYRTRYAITLWYFDKDEREAECQRLKRRKQNGKKPKNGKKPRKNEKTEEKSVVY